MLGTDCQVEFGVISAVSVVKVKGENLRSKGKSFFQSFYLISTHKLVEANLCI